MWNKINYQTDCSSTAPRPLIWPPVSVCWPEWASELSTKRTFYFSYFNQSTLARTSADHASQSQLIGFTRGRRRQINHDGSSPSLFILKRISAAPIRRIQIFTIKIRERLRSCLFNRIYQFGWDYPILGPKHNSFVLIWGEILFCSLKFTRSRQHKLIQVELIWSNQNKLDGEIIPDLAIDFGASKRLIFIWCMNLTFLINLNLHFHPRKRKVDLNETFNLPSATWLEELGLIGEIQWLAERSSG